MDHLQPESTVGTSEESCIVCNESLQNGQPTFAFSQPRGVRTFNEASEERGTPSIKVSIGQVVHVSCRQIHTNKRKIATAKRKASGEVMTPEPPRLRSRTPVFDFMDHCFLCGTKILPTDRKSKDYFPASTKDILKSMLKICDDRGDDDSWALDVRHRVSNAIDLPAVDAVYHQVCSVNFHSIKGLSIPLRYQQDRVERTPGRRSDASREEAFLKVVEDLRQDDNEQTTVSDLVKKMTEITPDPYSTKYMRQKLEQHLGDSVVVSNINGRPDVVTFRTKAAKVLQDFYNTPQPKDEDERKQLIINAAADLIRNEIKSLPTSMESYPDSNKLGSLEENLDYVPRLLRTFLERLITLKSKDLKVATLGQCICQVARPRVLLAPIPFGLAVQMHHQFGSRFLNDSLNNHGLCVSYSEVLNFETSAACFAGTDVPVAGHFGQYIADNVDHNLRTLDGQGTVHAMGIIMTMTPGAPKKHAAIPRRTHGSTTDGLEKAKIAIRFYRYLKGKSLPLVFKKLPLVEVADKQCENLDTLWKVSQSLRPHSPGWSGMMQALRKGDHPGKSSIHFLPMIDLDPTDMTCIYSTLHFVATESKRQGIVPVVTFDQPLWWKSRTIILNEDSTSILKPTILVLGGFHTTMSYLGSIGHIMEGSGLKETLELVYAGNVVEHMLAGKAYARAVRGHFLVDAALNAILLTRCYDVPVLSGEEILPDTSGDIQEALKCCDAFLSGEMTDQVACQQDVFQRIKEKMETEKDCLSEYPIGKLWIQYMRMVDLLKTFLRSQRTGDFELYLRCLQDMLPYLAASGHNFYVKSVQIHLQDMLDLKETNPGIYNQFNSGLFVIRRSDRFWAGLPSDLVIEQALMRTIKSTGGLTRGRGMEDKQRTRWLLAMPACADINEAMQGLTGANYCTSDQHKDLTVARKERDHKDTYEIFQYLSDYNPFVSDEGALHSIATGVIASSSCNPHEAKRVGEAILDKMEGQNVFDFVFRRKDQIERMGLKQLVVDGEKLKVDPQLLFQRLLILANSSDYSMDDLLKYELSSQPTALFDKHGLLRPANKPQLADALPSTPPSDEGGQIGDCKPVHNVFDGGSLLQRFSWKKGETFDTIASTYTNYVKKFANPVVVFDGYQETDSSTKYATHFRRSQGAVGPKVVFSGTMKLKTKKKHFLANMYNKQRFIDFLSEKLQSVGIKTLQSKGDADLLIALTGVKLAKQGATHVIGEDTDLLVLLCHHGEEDMKQLRFRTDKTIKPDKNTSQRVREWDINALRYSLGDRICNLLPIIHAVGGCDTTSRLYGMGKGVPLKKAMSNPSFAKNLELLLDCSNHKEAQGTGEKILVELYGGKKSETLDSLRVKKFKEKVVKCATSVEVQNLPPTLDAAKYHVFRAFYQAKCWMAKDEDCELRPEDWGWQNLQGKLLPKTMDSQPAPDYILKLIRCQCKGDCSTNKCSCRKHDLKCTNACGECRGEDCLNRTAIVTEVDEVDL